MQSHYMRDSDKIQDLNPIFTGNSTISPGKGLQTHAEATLGYNGEVNTPPPFAAPNLPPKKSNAPLIIVIVVLCVVVPCALLIGVGYYVAQQFGKTFTPMIGCMMMYDGVRDSVEEYAKEHDGKLPNAATWQDDVRPYYAKWREKAPQQAGPFKPPAAEGDWSCKFGDKVTGISFNSDLAGKKWDEIKTPHETILLFEIEQVMKNAHAPYKERSDSSSPKFMGESRGWLEMPVEGSMENINMGK